MVKRLISNPAILKKSMSTAAALENGSSLTRPISPLRELGAYEALWTKPKASFRTIAERFEKRPGAVPSDFVPEPEALRYAQTVRNIFAHAGVSRFGLRIHGAGEYPEQLRNAEYPVEILYFQGWWDLADSPSVAVVGTREPSAEGRARARKLVRSLVRDNFTVVSGLAKGIDTEVHRTAIAEGGRTIAVIGTPLNLRYPKENARLQEQIAEEHLIISQVPVVRYQQTPNPTANRFFFVERNITMAALSQATVIIEAGETSGTLVQARHALKQGRKLFILESNFKNPALTWPAKFEEQGAVRVREYEHIREHLAHASHQN
jgi:DNA processing protein